jgi:hypothetical protein
MALLEAPPEKSAGKVRADKKYFAIEQKRFRQFCSLGSM